MVDFSKFNSLFSITSYFSTDDVCKQTIIEGFWSHFSRMISGCYHDVSEEHLQQYIDEACFCWNTRKMSELERFTDMFNTSISLVKQNNGFKLCIAA